MGFWSPQSLVLDARRHGVEVRRPDVNASSDSSGLEPRDGSGHGDHGPAVRLGFSYVRTVGDELAERIAAGRPYSGIEDFVRRSGVSVAQAEAFATAGAFDCFGLARREALWAAGALAQSGAGLESGRRRRPKRTVRTRPEGKSDRMGKSDRTERHKT